LTIELVRIPAGSFTMGSIYGSADELPVHRVTLSQDFYIGRYEITQSQWVAVMGSNPSNDRGNGLPVARVSWEKAVEFTEQLSCLNGRRVRLPTEAEWEYACRAETMTEYSFGSLITDLSAHAWCAEELDGPQAVGTKLPNSWGLYDMYGNVGEWCSDWYDEVYYAMSPAEDPQGPSSGFQRVVRGGSWHSERFCRSAKRDTGSFASTDTGIRIVAETQVSEQPCPIMCQHDDDCSDGLFCTGEESCRDDGQCINGGSPCAGIGPCDEAGQRCIDAFDSELCAAPCDIGFLPTCDQRPADRFDDLSIAFAVMQSRINAGLFCDLFFVGECPSGLKVLFISEGSHAVADFYDQSTERFVAQRTWSDIHFSPCYGRYSWPGTVDCDQAVIIEHVCGVRGAEDDVIDMRRPY
jgi:hypothetical protein